MEEGFFLEKDRIPVFIGVAGGKKREIEKKFDCKIDVDSKSGEVVVDTEDSLTQFILANVIAAVNMGHSPDSAMRLEDETFVLDTIDVKSYVKDHTRLKVVMGRIIGKEGSTRKLIEEITKCSVSVKDHYVSVIGPYENTILVHEALDMLIKGASHKSLYSYLERNKVNINTGLL
ncbi:MAG: KH domain-containing protein [Candidatus Woesearchaeota archaeon]|jgi:ribosomal RNA assembly protein|nr:KH domain-containing protein [Candidatus Woesearchaeota archaeon]